METTEITWKSLVDQVSALAQDAHEDYVIYKSTQGIHGYMPASAFDHHTSHRPVAIVFGEPIVENGEAVCTYEEIDRNFTTIHADKIVRLRGGQPGNDNAKKGKYPRRVLSLVGPEFDLALDHLIVDGNSDPSNDEVCAAIYAALKQVYSRDESPSEA